MRNERPNNALGWRKTVLALLCGILVGSQVNESIKVLQVYHPKSPNDSAPDMPVDYPKSTSGASDMNVVEARLQARGVTVTSTQHQLMTVSDQTARKSSENSAEISAAKEPDMGGEESKTQTHLKTVVQPTEEAANDGLSQHFKSTGIEPAKKKTTKEEPQSGTHMHVEPTEGLKATPRSNEEKAQLMLNASDTSSGRNQSRTFVNFTVTTLSPESIELLRNPPPTNRTMNACLFIMDDTIRLVEWLAYHYTVLPLGHLIVAIDPKSKRINQINQILEMWREYITIDAFYNDTFLTLDPYDGWGRAIWAKNDRPRGWFKNKDGYTYRSQAHKRRQNFFTSFCFGDLYEKKKRDWTLLTDTDEFVTFNYRDPGTEDATRYDSITSFKSKDEVDRERASNLPIRDLLPNLTQHVTIAQHLAAYEKVWSTTEQQTPRCLRVPGLTFSSHESNSSIIASDVPKGFDGSTLMTLRQRQHAAKDGSFSKAMLNLKTATGKDWFQFGSVLNVHTPNRRMCGRTSKQGFSGSGADYISSLFRIHHYKAGTIESYLERAGDWRGGGLWRFYFDRNMEPVGENSDLTPWFKWFVTKVGIDSANQLLMQPLNATYEEISNLRHIKEAKENIAKLVPSLVGANVELAEPSYYNRTNHTIGACMYILDDTVRLMEWLAYHYTVLPLSHLILGLDPKSQREKQIAKIIKTWTPFVKIERYANDTWLADFDDHSGWKRKIHQFGDNVTELEWFTDKSSREHIGQAHKRRQNTFIAQCLVDMKNAGHDWVFVSDSDEFLIFNYPHEDEDPKLYDTIESGVRTEQDIKSSRVKSKPARDRLPRLQEHVTIADFVHGEEKEKCYRLPSLNFSAHQDEMKRLELSPSANLLVSLLQHRTGRKEGIFSKALLDVTVVATDIITWGRVDSVHSPNRRICGYNGKSGSGADYMASVLRINHYVAGSVEQYSERRSDFRGSYLNRFVNERHFEPVGVNNDIDYWIDWFIQKVGMADAENLLFKPLLRANKELAHIPQVKAAKTEMQEKDILPRKAKTSVEINDDGEAEDEE